MENSKADVDPTQLKYKISTNIILEQPIKFGRKLVTTSINSSIKMRNICFSRILVKTTNKHLKKKLSNNTDNRGIEITGEEILASPDMNCVLWAVFILIGLCIDEQDLIGHCLPCR